MTDQGLREFVGKIVPAMEIGPHGNPYVASFAGGRSGLSFGKFQHDVWASSRGKRQPNRLYADTVLMDILRAAGVSSVQATNLVAKAGNSGATKANFSAQELQLINNALATKYGKALVDKLDDQRRAEVAGYVKQVIEAAKQNPNGPGSFDPAHRDFKKTIGLVAAWVNRTGAPTKLLDFVRGQSVALVGMAQLPQNQAPTYQGLTTIYFPATKEYAPKSQGGNGGNWNIYTQRYERNFNLVTIPGPQKTPAPPSSIYPKRDLFDEEKTRELAGFVQQNEDPISEILLKHPSSWTESEVKSVMARPDYWNSPDRGRELVEKARTWHEQIYGTAPLSHDASGRMIHPQPIRIPNSMPTAPQDASGGTLAHGTQEVVKQVASAAKKTSWPQATRLLQSRLNGLSIAGRNIADPTARVWSSPIPVDGDFGPLTRKKLKETIAAIGSRKLIASLNGRTVA